MEWTTQENEKLISQVACENGLEYMDFLEEMVYDSVVAGICTTCKEQAQDVEPDARNYTCEVCGEQTVQSCLILAGLI